MSDTSGDYYDAELERIVNKRVSQKLHEANRAAELHFEVIQNHFCSTVQKACFECGLKCINNGTSMTGTKQQQDDTRRCVDKCTFPSHIVQRIVEKEKKSFQDELYRKYGVCRNKYLETRHNAWNNTKSYALNNWESCVNKVIEEKSTKALPRMVETLKLLSDKNL